MIGGRLTYSNDNFVASNRQFYSVIEANLMNKLNIKPVDNNQGLFIDNERDKRYIDKKDNETMIGYVNPDPKSKMIKLNN